MKITVFEPSGSSMKADYPELAEIEELSGLTNSELKFCWYVGNKTSSLARLKPEDRVSKAISLAWTTKFPDHFDRKRWRKLDFDDHIALGIQRMGSVKPIARLKALFTHEFIVDNLQRMVLMTEDEMRMIEADFDDKKKYVEICIKVAHELPGLIQEMEKGYGIRFETDESKNEIKASLQSIT